MNKSMCVFDLDGTLDLTDTKLSAEILKLSKMGVSFVTATGRTNSYVIDTCRKNNIIPPRFIIGDNGGSIYDTIQKKYIKRTSLPINKRKILLEEFLRLGGAIEDVRYTDGEYVYASDNEVIRRYYAREESIAYKTNKELLEEILGDDTDITKVTLAGNEKLMKKIIQFIEENGIKCWTDIGATKFPKRTRRNFRLDITDGETSKGEALEFLTKHMEIDSFTCIGNGPNDLSMFKYALDSDMSVVVVKDTEDGELTKESEELINEVKDYANMLGRTDNVMVASFPANGLIGSIEEKRSFTQRRREFVDNIKLKNTNGSKSVPVKKSNVTRRVQHKGEERW